MADEAQIHVEGLTKVFGPRPERAFPLLDQGLDKQTIYERTGLTVGVREASFDIHQGEVFVIMGLSGSGKSTLVRLLNRLIEPSRGHVYLRGTDVAALSRRELIDLRRRDMSMVFQSFALFPYLTVLDNAAFGLEIAGVKRAEARERAQSALEDVGLGGNPGSYPDELSGGMQQRVGLARALAADPSIMLMDEAFSALDPLIRTEMQDQLLRLQAETPRTVVFISHDLDEALRVGDRIAIMEGGRVLQVGTPDAILREPADDYVRSFFRSVDVSQVLTAADIARQDQLTIVDKGHLGLRAALQQMHDYDRPFAYVHDRTGQFLGMVSVGSVLRRIKAGDRDLEAALFPMEPLAADTEFQEVMERVADNDYPLPVVNEAGQYLGAVSQAALLRTLEREE
jgi:glycine betaine/proline transport system ATP-binding protein